MPDESITLLPARMVNEWVYCPRLAVLEHLHHEWAPSAETEDGNRVHRNVDRSVHRRVHRCGDGARCRSARCAARFLTTLDQGRSRA